MRSNRNSRCLEVLRELSEKKCSSPPEDYAPLQRLLPHTARKLVFADEDKNDLMQTVRCKAVGKYICEETPALP